MQRTNLYALIIITIALLLFCLAAANAQEADNDRSLVTRPGDFITGIEDAYQQDELWDTTGNLDLFVGDFERELFSFGDISDRLDVFEALWDGPGPAYLENGHCILATAGAGGLRLTLQHQTVVRYMAQFDSLPTEYSMYSVQGDPESSEILIFYKTHDERPFYVIERWQGCEFRGSSDWMAAEG